MTVRLVYDLLISSALPGRPSLGGDRIGEDYRVPPECCPVPVAACHQRQPASSPLAKQDRRSLPQLVVVVGQHPCCYVADPSISGVDDDQRLLTHSVQPVQRAPAFGHGVRHQYRRPRGRAGPCPAGTTSPSTRPRPAGSGRRGATPPARPWTPHRAPERRAARAHRPLGRAGTCASAAPPAVLPPEGRSRPSPGPARSRLDSPNRPTPTQARPARPVTVASRTHPHQGPRETGASELVPATRQQPPQRSHGPNQEQDPEQHQERVARAARGTWLDERLLTIGWEPFSSTDRTVRPGQTPPPGWRPRAADRGVGRIGRHPAVPDGGPPQGVPCSASSRGGRARASACPAPSAPGSFGGWTSRSPSYGWASGSLPSAMTRS